MRSVSRASRPSPCTRHLAYLLLCALCISAFAAEDPPTCDGAACTTEEDEVSELLQRKLKSLELERDANEERKQPENNLWVTFEGGGFRALSAYVGITAGLLAAKGAKMSDKDGIFSRAANIGSNSGGSWFSSMLIYSKGFLDKIDTIASDPKGQEMTWYNTFLAPFLENLLVEPGSTAPLKIPDENGHDSNLDIDLGSIIEILLELGFAVGMSTNWEGLVKELFKASPADANLQLGSPVNAWAQGKIWRAAVSIPTLGGEGTGTCEQNPSSLFCLSGGGAQVTIRGNKSKHLAYKVNAGSQAKYVPAFLPAGISVWLGDGILSRSPHRFTVPRFRNMFFEYEDAGLADEVLTANSPPVGVWSAFEFEVGKFPISAVIGASSAFLGGLVMINQLNAGDVQQALHELTNSLKTLVPSLAPAFDQLDKWLYNLANTDWSLWGSNKADGTGLEVGRSWHTTAVQDGGFVDKTQFKKMAGQGMFSMVDGGYTDNTAVATAVAQGATEVTVFLNGDGFFNLFQGSEDVYQLIELLDINMCPFCTMGFQVFSNNTKLMQDLFKKGAKTLQIVQPAKCLRSIKIIQFDAMTQDNLWFGVSKGRLVHLNVVQVLSTLGMGGFGYRDYSILVSEVAQTLAMPENKEHADTIWKWVTK